MGFRALPIALSKACAEDDARLVKTLYDKYAEAEPHYQQSRLFNLALQAVRGSCPSVLSLCFDYGFSIDDGRKSSTIAMAAKDSCSIPMFELLVDRGGMDVNQNLGFSGDLLTSAVKNGYLEVVRFLLERGADPNSGATISGHEALVWAIVGHNHEILQALFDFGAEVKGAGPLIAAAHTGNLTAVELILNMSGPTLDLEEVTGDSRYYSPGVDDPGTALFKAAAGGHSAIVDVLVTRGADIGFTDREGRSVADVAEGLGHKSIAIRLKQLLSLWDTYPVSSLQYAPSRIEGRLF
ncbi:MAG: hypothetical protein L6R41_002061 [Letrouitia leprolyta]|nr:MAG: hypothetical protein L6R41_002061 [Letrouitia leprolyta]